MDEPSRAGLTISGRPRSSGTRDHLLAVVGAAAQQRVPRRRQALGQPDALGHDLVDGHARGHHARAGVGDAQQFQRALHRAVLAEAAVQRDEAALEALALELRQVALGRVEGMRIDALGLQRLQHAAARHQRDLALGRVAAHQHGDLAEVLGRSRGRSCLRVDARASQLPPAWPARRRSSRRPCTSPRRRRARCPGWPAACAAMSSTNTGSTLPATRTARASERPSAATMGASPAAYTSASSTASAWPMHLDEILEAVARAGVAVRLEGQHQAAAGEGAARGGQRGRHLDRVVAVVLDQRELAAAVRRRHRHVAIALEAPAHALELGQRLAAPPRRARSVPPRRRWPTAR